MFFGLNAKDPMSYGAAAICAFEVSEFLYKKSTTSFIFESSYQREASISLELVSKFLWVKKFKKIPPITHDIRSILLEIDNIYSTLSEEDKYNVIYATQILYWSGRYPEPTRDKNNPEKWNKKSMDNFVEIVNLQEYKPEAGSKYKFDYKSLTRTFYKIFSYKLNY